MIELERLDAVLRAHGVDRALITCDHDDLASAATIVRNGGVLEDVRNGKRRYWVDLEPRPQRMM